jgi:carbonic anhydrase/acetyltransferase-like protein (isoleucine patch superfamily)
MVNIQDGAVLHGLYGKSKVEIGSNVTVGHNAIIHGALIHDNVLIGMGAIVLDNTEVGSGSIVAAGSVVLERTKIEPGTLWAGVPAKFIKKLDPEKSMEMINYLSKNYVVYAEWYKKG